MREQTIILPVRWVDRELHAKLLLATQWVGRGEGNSAVLGRTAAIIEGAESLPKGFFVDNNLFIMRMWRLEAMARGGHSLAAFDEEATGFEGLEDWHRYTRDYVDCDVLAKLQAVFCWGHTHATAVASKRCGKTPLIVATGHPRFDLLQQPWANLYSSEVKKIKKRYGNFLLFTINTGENVLVNRDKERWQHNVERGFANNTQEDWLEHAATMASLRQRDKILVQAIKNLAKEFPGRNMVVRPHPMEPRGFEKRFLSDDASNIYVDRSKSNREMLLAASAVIHSNCTSGIEAVIAGVPTVAVIDGGIEANLASSVSHARSTIGDLGKTILSIEANGFDEKGSKNLLRQSLACDVGASERILDQLQELAFPHLGGSPRPRALRTVGWPLRLLKDSLSRHRIAARGFAVDRKIELAEVRGVTRQLGLIQDNLQRIKVRQIDHELFSLSSTKL